MKFEKTDYEKRLRDYLSSDIDQMYKNMLLNLFPELAESEDERIRKELINFFTDKDEEDYEGLPPRTKIIAYLEKQGEQKPAEISNICEFSIKTWIKIVDYVLTEHNGIGNYLIDPEVKDTAEKLQKKYKFDAASEEWDRVYRKGLDAGVNKGRAEALREQKPVDKVEPKFKVGDWVIDVQGVSSNQIIGYEDDSYYIETSCSKFYLPMKLAEKNYRLWTIQDAKDGDVLDANGAPFIYKKHDKDYVHFYCGVNFAGEFIEANGIDIWNSNHKVYPATKEQSDLLFQKMHEAGYEWDAEKKELKKVEHTAWSEEDEHGFENCLYAIKETFKEVDNPHRVGTVNWLKSLKDRYTWKPSEEQISVLSRSLKYINKISPNYCHVLEELLNQLKKLKG